MKGKLLNMPVWDPLYKPKERIKPVEKVNVVETAQGIAVKVGPVGEAVKAATVGAKVEGAGKTEAVVGGEKAGVATSGETKKPIPIVGLAKGKGMVIRGEDGGVIVVTRINPETMG